MERPGDLIFAGMVIAALLMHWLDMSATWVVVLALGVGWVFNEIERKRQEREPY